MEPPKIIIMEEKTPASGRVPVLLVFIGGLSFIISAFTGSPWVALIGILDGIHIRNTYPDKKVHWVTPVALNAVAFVYSLFALFASSLA